MLSVFQNLIHNAINYSTGPSPWVKITARREGDRFNFIISDNGNGIADKIKDKVFDMFYRGHPDSTGSGLGLFIVRNALEKMNGTIRFESVEKQGTSFFVSIPVNQNEEV
jgi:signal transduction histidine kinase